MKKVSSTALKTHCRALAERFFRAPRSRDRSGEFGELPEPEISEGWAAFLFPRYPGEGIVNAFRSLPEESRYFYQENRDRYRRVSIWCVRVENLDRLFGGG